MGVKQTGIICIGNVVLVVNEIEVIAEVIVILILVSFLDLKLLHQIASH